MEGKEEPAGEGGRRKRLSKGIRELTGRFEEEGGSYDSQPEVRCGRGRKFGRDNICVKIFKVFKI